MTWKDGKGEWEGKGTGKEEERRKEKQERGGDRSATKLKVSVGKFERAKGLL